MANIAIKLTGKLIKNKLTGKKNIPINRIAKIGLLSSKIAKRNVQKKIIMTKLSTK